MKPTRSRPSPRRSAIRTGVGTGVVIVTALAGYFGFSHYRANTPRARALSTLGKIEHALTANDSGTLVALVELPPGVVGRAPAEQARWISDVLRDEVSGAGLAELRRHARFGPLLEVFPADAARWAAAANLPAAECLAFRLERADTRAEVVLHQSPSGFRVLRCNNVRQMTSDKPL